MSLSFRAAELLDVPALVALVESAYRGDASREGWTTEADLLQGQRTDVEAVTASVLATDGQVVVAEWEGRLVATCHLQNRSPRVYFGMFAVDPTLQGSGVGKQVIAHAEQYARDAWAGEVMEMTVIRQRTELIDFYLRRGYTDTGVLSPFPYGDERFGVPQRADLAFTLLEKPLVVRS